MNLHDREDSVNEMKKALTPDKGVAMFQKGDLPGHEFHGNQHTDGGGGAVHPALAAVHAKSIKESRSKLFDAANNLSMMRGHPDPKVSAAAAKAEKLIDEARQLMFDVDK